jgi:hypothetical protein
VFWVKIPICADLKFVTFEAGDDVHMGVKDILEGGFTISQEQVDAFTPDA